MPNNVFDTLDRLMGERFRTAIIHATPEKSPALSAFSQKVCQRTGGKYMDLLELFIQTPSLSEKIDIFGPGRLKDLLVEQSLGHSFLVVDRADFLLDTWRRPERQDFYRFINNQWDGYKESMKTVLIFALQTSLDFEALSILDSQGQHRIFQLSEFNDIG